MARPNKIGLDYYSFNTTFDSKIEKLLAKHGVNGLGVLTLLYTKIFREGYYIVWDEDEKRLFKRHSCLRMSHLDRIIDDMMRLELLNRELFEKYSVLTSRGIQKMYIKGAEKRKQILIIDKYCLVSISDTDGIFFQRVSDELTTSDDTLMSNLLGINAINKTERQNKKETEIENKQETEIERDIEKKTTTKEIVIPKDTSEIDNFVLFCLNVGVSASLTEEFVIKYNRKFIENLINIAKQKQEVKNKIGWVRNYLEQADLPDEAFNKENIDRNYVSSTIEGIVNMKKKLKKRV